MNTVEIGTSTVNNFIDGDVVAGSTGRTQDIFNPATGRKARSVCLSSAADVDAAVQAAKAAFPAWANLPPLRRVRLMNKFLALVNAHKDDLARAITAEHGKVFSDAKGEVERGIDIIEFACGMPQLLKGDFTDQVSTNIDTWTLRQPLGVVAGITPFNFPVMVPAWMYPIAIAAGNTFVLKPSPIDPTPSLMVAELMAELSGVDVAEAMQTLDPVLRDRIAAAVRTGTDPESARARVAQLARSVGERMRGFTALLGPTVPFVARREDSLEEQAIEPLANLAGNRDPESEVVMAESIGLALLVVLGTLAPAERITFVLHDLFDLRVFAVGIVIVFQVVAEDEGHALPHEG